MKNKKTAGSLLKMENYKPFIAAVIGCGGKTTFINKLAIENSKSAKVLITTTTKIMPAYSENVSLRTTIDECLDHVAHIGIQCFGVLNKTTRKMESLPLDLLEEIIPLYDVVLIEADGSAGLPCKGWLETEPVIPPYCTHTIGIVTIEGVGRQANSEAVMRRKEFYELTGLSENNMINVDNLTAMIFNKKGMFWNSVGQKSLWVNKIELKQQEKIAIDWLTLAQKQHPKFLQISAFGSAEKNQWEGIYINEYK